MEKHPFELNDKQLIDWLVRDQTNNVPIGELTRRNTYAIIKLDKLTTKYSRWLLFLTVVLTVLALFTLFVSFAPFVNGKIK